MVTIREAFERSGWQTAALQGKGDVESLIAFYK